MQLLIIRHGEICLRLGENFFLVYWKATIIFWDWVFEMVVFRTWSVKGISSERKWRKLFKIWKRSFADNFIHFGKKFVDYIWVLSGNAKQYKEKGFFGGGGYFFNMGFSLLVSLLNIYAKVLDVRGNMNFTFSERWLEFKNYFLAERYLTFHERCLVLEFFKGGGEIFMNLCKLVYILFDCAFELFLRLEDLFVLQVSRFLKLFEVYKEFLYDFH